MSDERRPRRDVYSGDLTNANASVPLVRVAFDVRVDSDPGALPRVASTLALANVSPLRLSCERSITDELIITAVLDGITATVAELILRKLQQLSVVVEASSAAEEMPRPVGSPSPP
jgi:hypothetical protein